MYIAEILRKLTDLGFIFWEKGGHFSTMRREWQGTGDVERYETNIGPYRLEVSKVEVPRKHFWNNLKLFYIFEIRKDHISKNYIEDFDKLGYSDNFMNLYYSAKKSAEKEIADSFQKDFVSELIKEFGLKI